MMPVKQFYLKFFPGAALPTEEDFKLLSRFLELGARPDDILDALAPCAHTTRVLGILARAGAQIKDERTQSKLAALLRKLLMSFPADTAASLRQFPLHPPARFLTDTSSSAAAETILSVAVRPGNLAAVDSLLLHPCVVAELDRPDASGCTPLHRACQSLAVANKTGDLEAIANKLLDAGADVQVREHAGRAPGSFIRFSRAFSDATRARLCFDGAGGDVCPPLESRKRVRIDEAPTQPAPKQARHDRVQQQSDGPAAQPEPASRAGRPRKRRVVFDA